MNVPTTARKFVERLFAPSAFELTEELFLRLLGLTYLAAFASLWPQIDGLIGSHGVAPAAQLIEALQSGAGSAAFWDVPSLFWFFPTDSALVWLCALGCIAALLLLCGAFRRLAAVSCFVLYLSLVSIGQPFTAFQWDALLLECGFLAFFTGTGWLIWAYRFLLFRLMFESGVVKLASHDPNWRNLHALRFHFMTQPLPNPIAYYAYRLPPWMLDGMTAATLCIELAAPCLLFCPRRFRQAGVALLILLQLTIVLTGNYAFFNLLALALCLCGLDDRTFAPLSRVLHWRPFVLRRYHLPGVPAWRAAGNVAIAILIFFGAIEVVDMLGLHTRHGFARPLAAIAPFEIVNTYGLFAVMTTTRPEIVLEGSDDQVNWREYSFPYKPGNVYRGLPFVAPYQPRLDWQMWFAALGSYQADPWAGELIFRLLTGEKAVLGLLDFTPFEKPPRYIRALLYEYDFTLPSDRARTGAVWRRTLRGVWLGPVSLKQP
ncbi:MAG TPA: lipase maturation factor family protein [Bryobacteraceae bacterium]|jgi:hypothetical protein